MRGTKKIRWYFNYIMYDCVLFKPFLRGLRNRQTFWYRFKEGLLQSGNGRRIQDFILQSRWDIHIIQNPIRIVFWYLKQLSDAKLYDAVIAEFNAAPEEYHFHKAYLFSAVRYYAQALLEKGKRWCSKVLLKYAKREIKTSQSCWWCISGIPKNAVMFLF